MDIELCSNSNLNNVHNSALFNYPCNISTDAEYVASVLRILIEDCHAAHRARHNKDKMICNLKVGDVIKAHVQVDSVVEKGVVGKLSYQAKGPLIITVDLGDNSFEVQTYDDPNSAKQKYKNMELYILLPSIFPL